MRQTFFLSLVVAYLACAALRVEAQSNLRANATPELQLTTEVLSARFCESDYLRLQLRLRYFNSSNQPIILSRQSNTIMTYFISRTVNNAKKEKYEQNYSPMQSPIGEPEQFDNDSPNDQAFVILEPAGAYEITAVAHLPFIYDGKDEDPDLVRPGRHVLEIRVQTWLGRQDATPKLRDRWRAHGYLWSQSIVSKPMIFSIAEHPSIGGCPN